MAKVQTVNGKPLRIGDRRLLLVAQALDESKYAASFTMSRYAHHVAYNVCGTPACALGHYCHRTDLQSVLRLNEARWPALVSTGEEVGYSDDFVRRHFQLNAHEAELLFGSHGCGDAGSPREAAAFIKAFVAGRQSAYGRRVAK